MPIKRKRVSKASQLRFAVMHDINATVAGALKIAPENVKNSTSLDYFSAMAVTFDLHKKYPTVSFPEDKFDKFCRVSTLSSYMIARLTHHKKQK